MKTTRRLGELTTDEVRTLTAGPRTCVLVPVGSVEPHGPHLPLATDTLISEAACVGAADVLVSRGVATVVAPSVPYGVTDYAAEFPGAIGVPAGVLQPLLEAIVRRFHADGWTHVCLVNNHLEPAHDATVRAAIASFPKDRVSVACPLTRRWARTLSDEFKRGACHAGEYETSLVLAAGGAVRADYKELPRLDVSLSNEIKAGKTTFRAMGMERAYTGAPADASPEEGDRMMARLVEMIVAEVGEALVAAGV
jgi:creatinine amidohydrolase